MTRQMSLRQVADCLDIESWRVLRLSRFLGLSPYDSVIPNDEIDKINLLSTPDDRYIMLRDWLLSHTPQPL